MDFRGQREDEIIHDPHSPIPLSPPGGEVGDTRKHEREVNSDNSDPQPKRQEIEAENAEFFEEMPEEKNEHQPCYEGDVEMDGNFEQNKYYIWIFFY